MAIAHLSTRFELDSKKREELAWAAGFWDGEGCMTIAKGKDGRIRPYGIVPQTESNKAILERFIAAVAPIECKLSKPVQNKRNGQFIGRPVVRIRFIRFEAVQALGAMLWKWLGDAKRQQFRRVMLAWANQPPTEIRRFNTVLLPEIYRRYDAGETQRSLSRRFDVRISHLQGILRGKLHKRHYLKFYGAEAKRCGARLWPLSLVGSTPTRPSIQPRLFE